jgi:hypothetical protein
MAEHVCRNCSTSLDPSVSYCEQCGENNPYYVKPTKKERDAYQQSYSSSSSTYQRPYAKPVVQEGNGVGWLFFGLFFPIIGIILYFAFKQEKPVAASRVLTGSLIRLAFGFFLLV